MIVTMLITVITMSLSQPSLCNDGNIVRLNVYMESRCPDTSRFVRDQLMPTWNLLRSTGRVALNVVPFGKANCTMPSDGDYNCTCQHGPLECTLNQLMNCVIEAIPESDQYIQTLACIQGRLSIDEALALCIAPNDSISTDQMQQCVTAARGRSLLASAGEKTHSLSPPLNFVPWIMINGERVPDALYHLHYNICRQLDPTPDECSF